MAKRAVLYARVSTDEQADKGYSLPTQLQACRKYAERLGFELIGSQHYRIDENGKLVRVAPGIGTFPAYVDDFTGTVPIGERPEGRKLAAVLKAKQADAIIGYQVDRLSRDNIDLLIAVRMWRQSGIEIHTVETGKIENENNILLVIKGWQAAEEHGRIKERMRRGALAKTRAGKISAVGGHVPYGYRIDEDTYVIVEVEAGIVKLIYVWYVHGDENSRPMATSVIARRLSEMRVKAPGETRFGRPRVRPSGVWGTAEVLNILSSEKYVGIWRYGDIIAEIPAIVDRELWKAAQERRAYNKQMARRNSKHPYLLRGMIRCGICDKAMTGVYDKRTGNCYYRCSWMCNHHLTIEPRPCSGKHIEASEVEAKAWEYAQKVIFGKDFERGLRKAQQGELDALSPKRDQLDAVEKELQEADKEVDEIALAMRKAKGKVGAKLQHDQDQVNARIDALMQKREELQADLAARRLSDDNVEALLNWRETRLRKRIEVGREGATHEDKRELFELLGLEVTVCEGKVENMTCLLDAGAIVPNLVSPGKCTRITALASRCAKPPGTSRPKSSRSRLA